MGDAEVELLPCPFCGGDAGFTDYQYRVEVGCINKLCDVSPSVYWQKSFPEWNNQIIAYWNRRAIHDN